MKRLYFLFITFTIIAFSLFGCTTTSNLELRQLYSINTEEKKDLEGDYSIQSFMLYKNINGWGDEYHIITIDSVNKKDSGGAYFLSVHYIGAEWEFINRIVIKLDGTVFSLTDNDPSREVLNGGVQERCTVELNNEIIKSIINAKEIRLQYYSKYKTEPIEIPSTGVDALRIFIK